MARPYRTNPVSRPPVVVAEQARPQLDVVAPLNVQTPGANTDKLQGLVQALGLFGGVMAGAKKERDEYNYNQGVADEQIGEADVERAKHSKAYAHGAYNTVVLEQYQNAQAKVSERAASELDHTLPIEQQVDIIDGWMKSELGPLTADPRAKVIFAERYQQFINQAAANIQKNQVEAHAKAAADAWSTDLGNSAQDGSLTPDRWNEIFHNWVSQSGDPVATRNAMVSTVANAAVDAAAKGGDYKAILDQIPTEVIGTDGSVLPGPMHSPAVRGMVVQATAQAERAYDAFQTNEYAKVERAARLTLDSMLRDNDPIVDDTAASLGVTVGNKPSDTFTPAQWASYVDRSATLRAKAAAKAATYESYMASWKANGRLSDILNAPGGPDSKEKLDDFADEQFQRMLYAAGVPVEGMSGEALVTNQEALGEVLRMSADQNVTYRPLENAMTVNPAFPGDVMSRLSAYEAMKRSNLDGKYIKDNDALVYEVALGAKTAGMGQEAIAERIRSMGDKDNASYVAAKAKDIGNIFDKGFQIKTGNWIQDRSINSSLASNPDYLAGTYRSLALSALSAGMSGPEAQKFAKERLEATHTVLQLDSNWAGHASQFFVLPSDSVRDPEKATAALDWYINRLSAFAKKHGIPEDEEIEVKPVLNRGRRLTFAVFRAGGAVKVDNSDFTLDGLLQTYQRMNPQEAPQAKAARRQDDRQAIEEARKTQVLRHR